MFSFLTSYFRYLYFFEKGNPQITSGAIQGLIELIQTEMQSDSNTSDPSSDAFFASTLRYIQFQKQKGGAIGDKYSSIKVWHSFTMCSSRLSVEDSLAEKIRVRFKVSNSFSGHIFFCKFSLLLIYFSRVLVFCPCKLI